VIGPTPYPELNGLLAEVEAHARTGFGAGFVGMYLVGSFAIGDADEHSDCDFLVVVRERPDREQEQLVRDLWAELPTRPGKWTHDLEGSYALLADLGDNATVGRPWFFVNHGHTEVVWDDHCNREVVRWTLHERGVTLAGPDPRTFTAPVPADLVRARMRRDLDTLLADILSWAPPENAWSQRYVVSTYCRVLYSLATGQVASKRGALEWAMAVLDARWRPLLEQVRDDRGRGWDPQERPRSGSLEAAFVFARWCEDWAAGR
jgi:hypothetical protein